MKHNIYYDGKVKSLGLVTDARVAIIGVIEPGTYTFSIVTKSELMLI